jgi:hypothetical protein
MDPFRHPIARPLALLVAVLMWGAGSPASYAQESASSPKASADVTPEALAELLPEPAEGWERGPIRSYEDDNGANAQAEYVHEDGETMYEVQISPLTESWQQQLSILQGDLPPGIEVSRDDYQGHIRYVIEEVETGKTYLMLPMEARLIYMEGNADASQLRAALEAMDMEKILQYE